MLVVLTNKSPPSPLPLAPPRGGAGPPPPPPGPGMTGRHDEDKLVEQAGGQAFLSGMESVPAHYPQVELVASSALLDQCGVPDLEVQPDPGIAALERGDHGRQDVDSRRGAGADEQRPAPEAAQLRDRFPRARERRENAVGMIFEDAAGVGQRDASAETIEDPGSERALELGDVLGQRGLAQMKGLGRAPKAPRPRHRQEHLELTKGGLHKARLIGQIRT